MSEGKILTEVLDLLAVNAYVAWSNVLSGCNSNAQNHYFEQMENPENGDLVLEITSMGRAESIDRIGRLISTQRVPIAGWEDEDEPAPTEQTWTIKTLDGREFTWSNANFIVIPEDSFEHKGRL